MGSFQLALAMFTRTTSRIPGPTQEQGLAAQHEKPYMCHRLCGVSIS